MPRPPSTKFVTAVFIGLTILIAAIAIADLISWCSGYDLMGTP